jgi:pimeloyl-ACP methyl ester carboxylesterase
MHTYLLHGMARTPASMMILAARLKRAGYPVRLFGYSVTVESLDEIVDRFVERVRTEVGEGEEYAVVGHSLGNVITRLAGPRLPPGFARFAMLAPPNRFARSAWVMRKNPIFKAITRDTGQRLGDQVFYEALPRPDVPSLIIAGNAGPRARWLPLGAEPNDGILTVEESQLDGVPMVQVPALHTWLMNRRDVFRAVRDFLAAGAVENRSNGGTMAEAAS